MPDMKTFNFDFISNYTTSVGWTNNYQASRGYVSKTDREDVFQAFKWYISRSNQGRSGRELHFVYTGDEKNKEHVWACGVGFLDVPKHILDWYVKNNIHDIQFSRGERVSHVGDQKYKYTYETSIIQRNETNTHDHFMSYDEFGKVIALMKMTKCFINTCGFMCELRSFDDPCDIIAFIDPKIVYDIIYRKNSIKNPIPYDLEDIRIMDEDRIDQNWFNKAVSTQKRHFSTARKNVHARMANELKIPYFPNKSMYITFVDSDYIKGL